MGLLAEPAGPAGRLLGAVGVDLEALTTALRTKVGPVTPPRGRPMLGKDSAKALRAARRHARRSGQLIGPVHLLLGLSQPLSGWARRALKETGATLQALKRGHRAGAHDHHPGIDADAVDWVWDYLPQAGRLIAAGEEAQGMGNLPAAIASYEQALEAAKDDELVGGAGDIYPMLIQANLLVGDVDRAVAWLDEADRFLDTIKISADHIGETSDRGDFTSLVDALEASAAVHLQDLRLQLLKDRANIYLGRDDFRLAIHTARKLITTAEELGHPNALAAGRSLLGMALTYTGEDDDAAEQNLVASRQPAEYVEPVDLAARTYSLALLAGLRGDHAAAVELGGEAEALFANLGLQRSVAVARLAKAEAEIALGGPFPPRLVDDTARVDPSGKAELYAWALRVRAAAERSSNPGAARDSIEQAISMSRTNGHKLLLVRCLLEQGRVLVALGDRRLAHSAFREALQLSRELGARFADDAHRELEELTDS